MVGLFQHFKVYHHIAGKEYPVLHAVLLQLVILQTVKTKGQVRTVQSKVSHCTVQLSQSLQSMHQYWYWRSSDGVNASLNGRRPFTQNYQSRNYILPRREDLHNDFFQLSEKNIWPA